MSSKRRLYLNLKQSITKLFKTPAHYLKEMTGKWSIFDKPYLDQDYRAMHLKWSAPTWGGSGGAVSPRVWPIKSRIHTVIFSEGDCSLTTFGGECGEVITIGGWISNPYLWEGAIDYAWTVTSSEPENASIIGVEKSLHGISVTIEVQLSDDWTGTATICAKAVMSNGQMLKEIAWEVPGFLGHHRVTSGWIPSFEYALANLLPLYEKLKRPSYDCGCVDIEIACCDGSGMAWDSAGSASTIAREASATVAITDSTEMGGPYTWSVSGTGFTLDNATTVGLTNTLNADATACGSAEITVTGCDGTVVTGYVRCTTGAWIETNRCIGTCAGGVSFSCYMTVGKKQYWNAYYLYGCVITCPSFICPGGSCDDSSRECPAYANASNCGQYREYEWEC